MESTESSIRLQQYWLILKRRWLPASVVFVSVFAITALSLLSQKPVYIAEGKLVFKKTSTTSSLTGLGKEIGQLNTLQDQTSPVDTEADIVGSVPIAQKTITRLDLKDKRGNPLKLKQFLGQLKASHIKGTDLLQISYKDIDPKKAAAVVNTVMAVYLENNLLANRAEAVAARDFIDKQLPQAETTVRQAELAVRRFKEENKVVALQEEANSAVAIIADLQRQINAAQAGLADANAQSAKLQKELGMDLQEAVAVSSNSQVLKELQQVESQLATERSRFREDYPTIVSLKSKKANLQGLLQEQLKRVIAGKKQKSDGNLQISELQQKLTEEFVQSEARRLGLANQVAALSNLQATYRQRVNVLPRLEQKQRDLERQLQASQSTYSLLLQKQQEIRIAENQNIGNARVVSSAVVPEEPVASRKLSYLAAALLGILASVATVYVLETRDKSIKTVDEARKVFGFPLLGVIPASRMFEKTTLRDGDSERYTPEIVVRDSLHSSFNKAYRMLQANLKFLSSNKQIKVIVVTSSVPKEGKSMVSANLAVAMAQLGRKVLLVDADMYCPRQHQIWDRPNQLGLSNLLVGQAELKTAIKEVMVNLDLLTSGVMPSNPMALLDSQQMASLIDIFSANYDFTIIDTASLSVAAETPILGQSADGVLLVVRPGVVDATSAALAKEFLEQSAQNVLGQVINGVIPENEPYSYYYFSKEHYPEPRANTVQKSSPLLKLEKYLKRR
jgi:capsular exopolysaccharide synthesis family protein